MADEEKVHFTFADDYAPYFLLIFSPIFVISCLFGIVYTFLTTEVRYLPFFLCKGRKDTLFTSLITFCHFDAAETQARFPYNLPDRVESSQAVVKGSTRRSYGNICDAKRVDRDDCNDFFEMTSRTNSNCCILNLCFVTRKSPAAGTKISQKFSL